MKHLRIIETNKCGISYYYVEKRFFLKWKIFKFRTNECFLYRHEKHFQTLFRDLDKLLLVLKDYKAIYYNHFKLEPYINGEEEVEFYCREAHMKGTLKELQGYLDNYKTVVFEK